MKNSFAVIFVLFLASNCTIAQIPLVERTFNHAYQTECADFERYNSEHWLIGYTAYYPDMIPYWSGAFSSEVMVVDNEGEIVWKTFLSLGYEELKDILLVNEDMILALMVFEGHLDVFDCEYYLYILDKEGEVLKTIPLLDNLPAIEDFCFPKENVFLKMLAINEGNIWVVYNGGEQTSWTNKRSGILQLDLETEEVTTVKEWDSQTLLIYDAFLQSDGKIWLTTNEGVWKINQETEIEELYEAETPILKVKSDYSITKTHLLQFDTDLNITQSTDFSSRFDSLINFYISDDYLWVIGKTSNINTFHFEKILLTEVNEPPLLTIDILGTQNNPIGLQLFEDKVLVLGNEQIPFTPRTFFKTYDANNGSTQQFDTDIGIEKIDMWDFQQSELFTGFYFLGSLTVKNHGMDTIHQFYINYQDKFAGHVHASYPYANSNDTLNLAPNESITVGPLGFLIYGGTGNEKEICFWVTGPNDHIDRNQSNNSSCELVVLADISAPIADSNDMAIFPNPFHQKIEIHTQNSFPKDAQISVFNTLGQVVYQSSLKSNQTQTVLDLAGLQQGVYILEVKSEQEQTRWMERVVKY